MIAQFEWLIITLIMFDCTLLFIFIFYFFWLTLCLDDDVFFFKVQKGKKKEGKTALFIPPGNVVFSYISFMACFQVIFLIVPLAVDIGV